MKSLLNFLCLAALSSLVARAADPKPLPPFEELAGILRSNLAGVTEAEIQRAATQGLLNHFKGRVVLGNGKAATNTPAAVTRSTSYNGAFAYVRLARVEDGAAVKFSAAFEKLTAKQRPKGLVLDLRYATGGDYAAAAGVADLFLGAERPLIDWGAGRASSTAKEKPLRLPVAVIINGQTRGAAEALAAILRQTGAALVVGSPSAGEASQFKEFTLSDGQRLRLAAGNVTLGNGEALSTDGLTPDIAVVVSAAEERAFFADPFKAPAVEVAKNGDAADGSSTNAPRRRINEAELVRLQREGNLPDSDQPLPAATNRAAVMPAGTIINDPALARALDLLKALAIVQPVSP